MMRASFVKRFGRSELYTAWGYRQSLTVSAADVGADLVDFPIKISEANLDPGFWSHVSQYGREIVVTDSGDNRLDRELVFIDRTLQKLLVYVRVPLISSSSDTELRLYYGGGSPVSNSPGVWNSSYLSVLHLQNPAFSESTDEANTVALGAIGSSWKRPGQFEESGASGHLGIHQGVAWDGVHFYLFDTNTILKTDAAFSTVATNADPNADIIATTDHLGDGDVYGGQLYIPAEIWGGCGSVSNQVIAIFNASDLSYVTEHDISAQGHEVSSLVVEPDDDRITVTSYCNDDRIYRYRLSDFAFLGELPLSSQIENIQGITRMGDYYYITSDTADHDWIYRVRLDGTVDGIVYSMNDSNTNNIEGICNNGSELFVVLDALDDDGTQQVFTLVWVDGARFLGEDPSISEDYPYISVALENPSQTGTMSVWFSPADNIQRAVVSYAELGTQLNNNRNTIAIDDGADLAGWDGNGQSWLYSGIDPSIGATYGAFYRFATGGARAIGVNGVVENTGLAGTIPTSRNGLYIGVEDPDWNEGFNGIIHEVRFRSVVVSDEWAAFEDLNVRTPGSSYSVGAEAAGTFVI